MSLSLSLRKSMGQGWDGRGGREEELTTETNDRFYFQVQGTHSLLWLFFALVSSGLVALAWLGGMCNGSGALNNLREQTSFEPQPLQRSVTPLDLEETHFIFSREFLVRGVVA